MTLVNWNDDRLEEAFEQSRADLRTNSEAVSYLALQVNTLRSEVDALKDQRRDSSNSKFQWWVIAGTFLGSPLTALIVELLQRK